MGAESKKILPYIELLRAIAIVFVVFTHVGFDNQTEAVRITALFFNNGTVLFLIISGFLFEYLYKPGYLNYLRKKALYVVLPYLIIGTIVTLVRVIFYGARFDFGGLVYLFASGNSIAGPYWYIPLIVLLYISAPVIHWLVHSKAKYFVLVATLILSVLTFRPLAYDNPLLEYCHFFGIYFLGCMLGAYQEKFIRYCGGNLAIIVFGVLAALFFLFELVPVNFGEEQQFFEDIFNGNIWQGVNWGQLQKIALALFILSLSARYMTKRNRLVTSVAEASFGIFFLHSYFVTDLCPIFGAWNPGLGSWWAVAMISLLSSYGLVLLVKRIFGKRSRYLIGS